MAKKKPTAADDVQEYLPGLAPKKIATVHRAALDMLDCVRETKKAKASEDAAREEVRAAMEKAGIDEYEYGGLVVKIDLKRTPKVKQAKKQTEDGESEPEE